MSLRRRPKPISSRLIDVLFVFQAKEEKQEMDALQQSNRRILFNLLPSHVATHFLDSNSRTHLELYHQVEHLFTSP